jgi:hypothetical protein
MTDYALIADHGLIGDLPLNDRLDVAAGKSGRDRRVPRGPY